MGIKICCIFNDRGAWCTNKRVKRSLLGIGARCCSEYDENPFYNMPVCPEKIEVPRPPPPPDPPLPRVGKEGDMPQFPPCTIEREGSLRTCNVCGSSMAAWGRNGCVQSECANFYTGLK